MTEQNEGLLQLHNLILAICKDKYAIPEMMAERITKEVDNYTAIAKLAKLGWMSPDECQECQAQTEVKMELAVKQERERIIKMLEFYDLGDWVGNQDFVNRFVLALKGG